MQTIKEYWSLITFCLLVISTLAVAIYRLKMAEDHIKSHCTDLAEIVRQFQSHLTVEGIHNTAIERQTQIEYRARVEERLDQLYEGQGKIMRHLLTQRFSREGDSID